MVLASCLDPYAPPVADSHVDYLVVDAFLNSGDKSAQVILSKAVPLDASSSTKSFVNDAQIFIEGEDDLVIAIPRTGEGSYSAPSIHVENGKKYRLRIKTNGKEYLSDVVELKKSPSLDSVTWRADESGVTIYIDSHDENGSTKYYQWLYTESWEYHADELSSYIWDAPNAAAIPRNYDQMVYTCYADDNSTRVLISETTRNTQDIVSDFPLVKLKKGTRKLQVLYSILVQQRALDEDAFNYWQSIQKTTENVGTLFDALPTQVISNIHNIANKDEPVMGYFTGGEVQEKRIFIDARDLPKDLQVVDGLACETEKVPLADLFLWRNTDKYIVSSYGMPFIQGYIFTSGKCADCRELGGVLQKPGFWPQ